MIEQKEDVIHIDIDVLIDDDNHDLDKIGSVKKLDVTNIDKDTGHVTGWLGPMLLNRDSLLELFPQGAIHEKSQKLPMQILITEDGLQSNIHNVWITKLGYSYMAEQFIIINYVEFEAESTDLDK